MMTRKEIESATIQDVVKFGCTFKSFADRDVWFRRECPSLVKLFADISSNGASKVVQQCCDSLSDKDVVILWQYIIHTCEDALIGKDGNLVPPAVLSAGHTLLAARVMELFE